MLYHYLCVQHDLIYISWEQASNIRYTSSFDFVYRLYCDECPAHQITLVIINYEAYTIPVSWAKWYHPWLY